MTQTYTIKNQSLIAYRVNITNPSALLKHQNTTDKEKQNYKVRIIHKGWHLLEWTLPHPQIAMKVLI